MLKERGVDNGPLKLRNGEGLIEFANYYDISKD